MVKKCFIIIAILHLIDVDSQELYKDKSLPVEERVDDLLKRMTLEEKILQLNQYTFGVNNNINNRGEEISELPPEIGSLIFFSSDPNLRNEIQRKAIENSRLGIPILFGFDVIHGFRMIFPIPLGQAASWNPDLVKEACSSAAREAKQSGIDWTFSPMIDVARDPRWGRVAEGYGEDPYVNSRFGVASIEGYQGNKLSDPYSIAACLKHYIGYGMSEGGRDYRSTDISNQSLWHTYIPPFKAGVEAGAATVMSAFNTLNGVPATSNSYILQEVLGEKLGFQGFVVSDWNAIQQLINQGVAKDEKEAGLKAFLAGIDMDMRDNIYRENLEALIEDKKITMGKIDKSVTRILKLKFELGLFDDPYTEIIDAENRYMSAQSKAVAKKLATESMVLLKNQKGILPLDKSLKKIALIGPMAKDKGNLMGAWSYNGKDKDVVSIYEGFRKEFKQADIFYERGADFEGEDRSGFKSALEIAQKSDIIFVCLGEKKTWGGENASRSSITLPSIQEELLDVLNKTGKPIVLILSSGRPIELKDLEPNSDAILEIWQPDTEGGHATAEIISGRENPSGKLAITFPLSSGQIPTYYNTRPSARPKQGMYQDIPTEPLYSFGHGLSYSNFDFSSIRVSKNRFHKGEKIKAEISVTNTSELSGKETVLWFISDPVSSISRPVKS